ncbi:MAG TPA: hypothetical protein VIF15_04480 [Polyangiaceae bacterium]
MDSTTRSLAACALVLLGTACHRAGTLDPADVIARETGHRTPRLTGEERDRYLRQARLFDDVDPSRRDLLEGPPSPDGARFDAPLVCDFVEPSLERVPAAGTTPKFFCRLEGGDGTMVKVKYGRSNREIYGEVLASRLLWAVGVASDADYPVRMRCRGCPVEPWLAYRDFPRPDPSPRGLRTIDDAVVQRLYPGVVLQEHVDQGWSFDDLDAIDARAGGAPRAQVDAFRLLAAFIAHGDDKHENQRLVCPLEALDAAGRCRAPRLLIADLGSTFGRGANTLGFIDGGSRPTFAAWSTLPMWEDRGACRAHRAARETDGDPPVSEAGRRFLAARLSALTPRQIRDLFTAARIERLGETTRDPDGRERPVTVEDWSVAFERRRAEIVEARCP